MSFNSNYCEEIIIDDIYRTIFLSDFSTQSKINMKEIEMIFCKKFYNNYQLG